MKLFLVFIAFTLSSPLWAGSFYDEVSFRAGMVNISYTESASQLDTQSLTEEEAAAAAPGAGAVSSMSLDMQYQFLSYPEKAFYLRGIVPLMSTGGGSFFMVSSGANFYFKSLSSKIHHNDDGSSLKLTPKWRYFWGFELGIGYLIYTTEYAKKSDVIFDLGAHVGASYNFNPKWGLSGDLTASRGTGAVVSTIGIKIFVGGTYYFGD